MYPYPPFSSETTHASGVYFSCFSYFSFGCSFSHGFSGCRGQVCETQQRRHRHKNEVLYTLGKVTSHFSHDALLAEVSFPRVE